MAKTKTKAHKNEFAITNYQVGDYLIRIKNAALAKNREVEFKKTKFVYALAKALDKAGILNGVEVKEDVIISKLSYKSKVPVLMDLKLISKPGLRTYMSSDQLGSFRGPAVYIVSTSKGIMTSTEAIKNRLGGEVIAQIY